MTAVLNILLLILKWLGIILLVILGLILLVVLSVLLVPVRYKGKLAKKEAPEEILRADGLVSWLNPFLRVRIRYVGKKLCYTVRVFGLCLLNSEKPKKEKKEKKKKDKPETSKKEKPKKEKKKKQKEKQRKKETGKVEATEAASGIGAEAGRGTTESGSETAKESSAGTTVQAVTEPETEQIKELDGAVEKKNTFFTKIKAFIEKIKAIPETIKKKVRHGVNTVKLLWYKKEKAVAFFEDELHVLALGKAWKAVKQLLGHVLPGKIKGHAEFGTGDPESTGKALGVLGVMYAAYGKGLTIVPDFNEKRLVADLSLKGRIRCGTLLIICLRLIRDKQVKRFYRNWKKLLEILKQKAE